MAHTSKLAMRGVALFGASVEESQILRLAPPVDRSPLKCGTT